MLSELHSRLEHLVSYSSQLIFVSGETIAQQQRTLEAFLSQQSENTEVAFISAEQRMQQNDYRGQLCRQLLGQTVGSFIRPLNELLAALNQHEGPVLICITQAQLIPDGFLQELWELVLQSRFAGNKQHLNVLLFGEPEWAEHAKQWLPSKNSDKPLLLHSESVLTASSQESELEQLIADKRKEFDQRLRQRALPHPHSQPVLGNWWIRVLIVSVFLLTFCGILIGQYFDVSMAALGEFKDFVFQTNSQPQDNRPVAKMATAPTLSSNPLAEQQQSIADKPAQAEASIEATQRSEPDPNQRLITDWKTAIKQTPKLTAPAQQGEASSKPTDELSAQAQHAAVAVNTPSADISAKQLKPEIATTAIQATEDTKQQGQVNDYQVADVISVDQLPPREADADQSKQLAPDNPFAWDETILLAKDPEHYLLQLAGISDPQVLQTYLNDYKLHQSVWVYRTQRFGGDWFVVVYKQSFSSLADARGFNPPLPQAALTSPAFAKSIATVQQEIHRVMSQ